MLFLKCLSALMLMLLVILGLPYALLPEVFGYVIPYGLWGYVYMILPVAIYIFLVVLYCAKKRPLFVLSLSHFLFPFLLMLIMQFLRSIISIQASVSGWELPVFIIGIYYFFPFAAVTFIISVIIRARR